MGPAACRRAGSGRTDLQTRARHSTLRSGPSRRPLRGSGGRKLPWGTSVLQPPAVCRRSRVRLHSLHGPTHGGDRWTTRDGRPSSNFL